MAFRARADHASSLFELIDNNEYYELDRSF